MTLTSSTDQRATPGTSLRPSLPDAARLGSLARRLALRLGAALVTLWGAATLAFFAQLALPGDRATTIFNIRAGTAVERSQEELAPVVAAFGLDHPVLRQYVDYLTGLLHGDLGLSYQQFRPVSTILAEKVPGTLLLTLTAIALAWVITLVWTTLTAGRGRTIGAFGSLVDSVAAALPHYWLGIVLLLVFAAGLGWFPVISGSSPAGLVLPALTLAIPLAGFMGQSLRTELETVLRQPFITTARTRGATDLSVRRTHALRHALIPPVTLSGWALGATLSGAVVVESVFSRQGIGSALVTAVNTQDLPVVTGVVVFIAALYVLANLAVDVITVLIDPRRAA